jgi:4-aminobutyrate aminotransferase / (S)-3-amino-2-methylpropionate transaminase / 5-aminovalerate transaminase
VPSVATEHRKIASPIPAPGTAELLDRLERVESRSMHGQLPIVWDRAEGFSVFDLAGNKFIDFTSTIFVANVGHSNQNVSDAIRQTLDTPLYSSYAYANEIRAEYLEQLLDFAGPPFEKAFLLSAGTEATEAALKLMRMNGAAKGKRRLGVICVEGNWHGRTMGAQLMSSNPAQREWIGFTDPDIHHIPFPYPWLPGSADGATFLREGLRQLEDDGLVLGTDVCGFMLETFQGWGAVFYPESFVQEIESLCEEHEILLAFDEMQAGFARTGKAFGYQHYGVTPDLLCCGKGMGGGVPLSGVIGRSEVMDLPEVGNMSSTHSANPLVCAAGLAVLEEIADRSLVDESRRKGEILAKGLERICKRHSGRLKHLSGHGLIGSLLFFDPQSDAPDATLASKVSELCMRKGLLVVHTGRESIKLGPPLTISDEALFEGLAVLEESVNELCVESTVAAGAR